MNKLTFFFFSGLLTLLFSCATVQTQEESGIEPNNILRWTDTIKLSWADFTGKPPDTTTLSSELVVMIPAEFHPPTYFDTASTKVDCFMAKNASWVIKSKAKKQHLAYNQILFNIYELSARKLRKILAETDLDVMGSVGLFNDIHDAHKNELEETISQYRSETDAGVNTKILMEWAEKISQELAVFENYKSK